MEAAEVGNAVEIKTETGSEQVKENVQSDGKLKDGVVEQSQQVKKNAREEKSSRKKDDKSLEQVLKALSSLGTTEEKLAAMCKKYTEIVDENRKLQVGLKQCEKKAVVLQREKEQLQGDQSKAVLTRSRLESLCRELQRQNKAIKEESLLKIREEEEKRKEVSAKFQSIINEITALTQQNNENNSKLRDENLEMQKKFKTVCEQYELREQQLDKISKQMQLESQLADAKLAKAKLEMVAEKELLIQEKKQLLLELTAYQNKCQELQQTEVALRGQISLYTDKYDEFQNALARSNQVYGGFKGEMEKMSKKITKLEKETSTWKLKWESSHKALLQMAADKQQKDAELALQNRKLLQLQKLCRTLQSERSALFTQLKNEGLTPQLPAPGESETTQSATDVSTVKAKEAVVLHTDLTNNIKSSLPNDQSKTAKCGNCTEVSESKSDHIEQKVPLTGKETENNLLPQESNTVCERKKEPVVNVKPKQAEDVSQSSTCSEQAEQIKQELSSPDSSHKETVVIDQAVTGQQKSDSKNLATEPSSLNKEQTPSNEKSVSNVVLPVAEQSANRPILTPAEQNQIAINIENVKLTTSEQKSSSLNLELNPMEIKTDSQVPDNVSVLPSDEENINGATSDIQVKVSDEKPDCKEKLKEKASQKSKKAQKETGVILKDEVKPENAEQCNNSIQVNDQKTDSSLNCSNVTSDTGHVEDAIQMTNKDISTNKTAACDVPVPEKVFPSDILISALNVPAKEVVPSSPNQTENEANKIKVSAIDEPRKTKEGNGKRKKK